MKRSFLGLLGLLALVACGPDADGTPQTPPHPSATVAVPAPVPPTPTVTPNAPFRAHPPAPDGKIAFVAPKVTELALKNGLRVLFVERHDLPIVAVRLVITTGAGDLGDVRPGAISFLGGMLEQGTKKRTALQISDEFEALGAQHNTWFDWDSGGLSLKVLTDKLDQGLELMADVALNPTFPDAEIERLRARRIAGLQSELSSPGAAAQNTLAAAVFGRAHPYGHALSGEEDDAKKLTKAEITKAYAQLFVPQNAAVVVAGDITKDQLTAKLETAFGGWKPKPGYTPTPIAKRGPKPLAKSAAEKRIVIVNKPGAQSQVSLARPGVPFQVANRDAYIITNAIVGGMFTSRVNMNLREKHAYTYGARSYFAMRHGAGPFLVAAPVKAEETIPSVKEVIAELDGLRRDGPTADEMALAKENILLAMPGRFEGVAEVAAALGDLVVYDLPNDYYEKRPAKIEAVTADDVKKVANDILDPKAMTLILVGDKSKLSAQLLSLEMGAFEERDASGNLVKSDATPPKK